MFPTLRVDSRKAQAIEELGAKRKFWYSEGKQRMLLKLEDRGTGEDWAEKLACELAQLIGLPHVHYDLAIDTAGNVPGVVCPTFVPKGWGMGLGNQVLQALDPDYPEGSKYKVRAHTPDAVEAVLGILSPPPAPYSDRLPAGVDTAVGVFTGYVLLDAWIGNQDRHHQNWAVLRAPEPPIAPTNLFLAPSFDHGAAMARQLSDEERFRRLNSRDRNYQVAAFARKARSAFYAGPEETKSMTTLEVWQAFVQRAPQAAQSWMERLRGVTGQAVQDMILMVPPERMTSICREFTLKLLEENRRRLVTGELE